MIDVGTGAGFRGAAQNCARGHSPDAGGRAGETRRFLGRMQQYAWPYTGRLYSRARRELAKKEAHREAYDIAVSRAVANLATLSEYCLPFVRVGGTFAALKGPTAGESLTAAKNAIAVLGGGNACIKLAESGRF